VSEKHKYYFFIQRMRQLQEEQEQQRFLEQQLEQQRLLEQQMEQQRQRELDQQRELAFRLQEQQQNEMERLRLQQQQQQEQYGLSQQIEYLRQQTMRDRQALNEYELKFAQMQQQLSQMNLQAQSGSSNQNAAIQKLTEEIEQWKQKYEALAKLYGQLRKEHLDLLQKFKTIKDANSKVADEARKRIDHIQTELKTKANELTEVVVERNRLKGDADRIRLQYEGDLSRMRLELEQSKHALNDMSQTRGSEVQNLVTRFTVEQTKLEELLRAKQTEVNLLTAQLSDVVAAMEKAKMVYFFLY
jgi:huntingtin-interacting protein 1-related protein